MSEQRPRLEEVGSFGLQRTWQTAETRIALGLKRRVRVRHDDVRGALSWQLVFKVLPGTRDGGIWVNDEKLQSRADYLWGFFIARKSEARESFILCCPTDGKDYLAAFVDKRISYEMFAARLFSSGLAIEQVDEPDVDTLDDGSVAGANNPDLL